VADKAMNYPWLTSGQLSDCCGAKVGFFQGDIKLLTDDMKILKPTIFPVVPRLLNRIYDKVREQLVAKLS